MQSETIPPPVLYTVRQLADAEPALAEGGIRRDLFYRDANGLAESGAVVRRGRNILIHREKYIRWMAGEK